MVTDVRLPGIGGVELLRRMKELSPNVPVIVITAFGDVGTAVEVLKLGAYDYIVKPLSASAIQESTRIGLERAKAFAEVRRLRSSIQKSFEFGGILSKTPEMHKVFEMIRMVSATDTTVLVEGETGTGKELVASAINQQSPRRNGPFITINCAGIPETLLESELFGYERGAFTGADQARPGKIEMAHGGTLFLDEIESISLAMQSKLLRVLEEKKVQRLGGHRPIQVDMRVIGATNVSMTNLVEQGHTRSDFYYRISVMVIPLIPLRERRDDIPLLVQDFLERHPVAQRKKINGISKTVLRKLVEYHSPGNIRELQNVLERAIVLTMQSTIEKIDPLDSRSRGQARGDFSIPSLSLRQWLRQQEKEYLTLQLKRFGGSIARTARNSGMDVKTLYRKLQLHAMDKRNFRIRDS